MLPPHYVSGHIEVGFYKTHGWVFTIAGVSSNQGQYTYKKAVNGMSTVPTITSSSVKEGLIKRNESINMVKNYT